MIQHNDKPQPNRNRRMVRIVTTVIVTLAIVAIAIGAFAPVRHATDSDTTNGKAAPTSVPSRTSSPAPSTTISMPQTASPSPTPKTDGTSDRAKRIVEAMSLDERAGQLVMAALQYGNDPATLQAMIQEQHVGNVILMGNWVSGVENVARATQALQRLNASTGLPGLLIATDQEGGTVQHLSGPGFDAMPSATAQGQMPLDRLRAAARDWALPLKRSGLAMNLAPSVDTVTIERAVNEPIGALYRDFGLDAQRNGEHAAAFIEGMRAGGVGSAIKHYPGLGSVRGNTDFTANGIVDDTTTENGTEVNAFTSAIRQGNPAMVMVSLATYKLIDPDNPAAFSPAIVTDMLRRGTPFDGVVISDSLSAGAVSSIAPQDLGVRFIDAGGDICCMNAASYTQPILDGIRSRAAADKGFAAKVTASAERVVRLKIELGLVQ